MLFWYGICANSGTLLTCNNNGIKNCFYLPEFNNGTFFFRHFSSHRFKQTNKQTNRKVHVWAMRPRLQKAPMRSYSFEDMEFNRMRMDPSGSYVAICGDDQRVRIIDIISGACLAVSPARHSARITAVVFTPDCARLLTACVDGCIFVWKLASKLISRMRGRLDELGLRYSSNPLKSKNSPTNQSQSQSSNQQPVAAQQPKPPAIPQVQTSQQVVEKSANNKGAQNAQNAQNASEGPPALPAAVVQNSLGTTAQLLRDDEPIDIGATVAEMPAWAKTSRGDAQPGEQMPKHKCTNAQCTNVQCTNAQCTNAQMLTVQMHKCSMHKCTNGLVTFLLQEVRNLGKTRCKTTSINLHFVATLSFSSVSACPNKTQKTNSDNPQTLSKFVWFTFTVCTCCSCTLLVFLVVACRRNGERTNSKELAVETAEVDDPHQAGGRHW